MTELAVNLPWATSLIVTAIACLTYVAYCSALPKPFPNIPYDEAASRNILGSIPSMLSHIKKHGVVYPWLMGQNAKFGAPLIQFFGFPFERPTLVLSDFQESQDILLRRTKDFDRAQRTIDRFTGIVTEHHIAMQTSDPRFKGNKELVRDLMTPTFLQEVSASQIYAKSLTLVELWQKKAAAAGGLPFEARHDLFDAVMDMITAAAFAFDDELSTTNRKMICVSKTDNTRTTNSPQEIAEFSYPEIAPEITSLQAVVSFVADQIVAPFPRLSYWYRLLTDSEIRAHLRTKNEVIKNQLRRSVERFESGDRTQFSATDYIIQREHSVSSKESRSPNFYSQRAIDELFGYVVAGHETTATALSWMTKHFTDNPGMQQKLRLKLKSGLSQALAEGRQPTAQEILKSHIPYLDAAIEESLRLSNPIPIVAREAMRDTVLLGHHIPRGTYLIIHSEGPGYRSAPLRVPEAIRTETSRTKFCGGEWNMEDLHVFKPDRWLREGTEEFITSSDAGPFLAFSLGPRQCFGKKLAYVQMRIILTLLIWNFEFCQVEGEIASYATEEGVTVMPKHCYVRLERQRLAV